MYVIEKQIRWKWNDSLGQGICIDVKCTLHSTLSCSHRGSGRGGGLTDASGFAWVISETEILRYWSS